MLEKLPFTDHKTIDCLKNNYGINVATLTFLPLGADMNASVYKADAANNVSYFVKLRRKLDHDISVDILELLHNAGIKEIISPVKAINGQFRQEIDNFTLIVFPFIDGQDGFNRHLTDEHWVCLGSALRQIHELVVPAAIIRQMRQETYSSRWRDKVKSLYPLIEADPVGDDAATKLHAFMRQKQQAIYRLVMRAGELAVKLQNESPKIVLCHSDIHAGNVLIQSGGALYIVDWDEPVMAPKERDLMFIGGGVGNVWNKPHEETLFYKGYGKTEINLPCLSYYRHERIVEDIALYAQKLLLTTTGGAERLVILKHFTDMFAPNGVVEIAFRDIDIAAG